MDELESLPTNPSVEDVLSLGPRSSTIRKKFSIFILYYLNDRLTQTCRFSLRNDMKN